MVKPGSSSFAFKHSVIAKSESLYHFLSGNDVESPLVSKNYEFVKFPGLYSTLSDCLKSSPDSLESCNGSDLLAGALDPLLKDPKQVKKVIRLVSGMDGHEWPVVRHCDTGDPRDFLTEDKGLCMACQFQLIANIIFSIASR